MREDYGQAIYAATENDGPRVKSDPPWVDGDPANGHGHSSSVGRGGSVLAFARCQQAITLVRCPCEKHLFDWIGGRWFDAPPLGTYIASTKPLVRLTISMVPSACRKAFRQ